MVDNLLMQVAKSAYPHVIEQYNIVMLEHGVDPEAFDTSEVDIDLYLFVYADGGWLFSDPSSLINHRNILAIANVCSYDSVESLYEALELGFVFNQTC